MTTQEEVRHLTAAELIDVVLDAGSFASWDRTVVDPEPSDAYRADLAKARAKAGTDESVLTGEGLIRGSRVAIVVSEFAFLAGSIGLSAADRIVEAIERATREGLPVLAGPASGGTRMQEGTLAFLSMVKITAAVRAHRAAGHPYLVYLRHPTTGGVMASWGSLGHVTVAEPGALLGFLGPRVYEALYGKKFPENVQVSENLFNQGLIDAVVPPEQLPEIVHRALTILTRRASAPVTAPDTLNVRPADAGAWASIQISRNPRRPDLRQLLAYGAHDVLPLNGTGEGEKDPGLMLAMARFGQQSCIVLGHIRPRPSQDTKMGPGSLREARRGMRLAEELGIPLLTVIDTAGAALSKEAEEGGMAGEIARSLHELIGLKSATVSVLLGQGAGGGALALLPADRTIAAQHSWLSPLPPEGASAIVHRSTEFAPAMSEAQGVNVASLYANGIVDHIVDERPDAAEEGRAFCERLAGAIEYELSELAAVPVEELLPRRVARYHSLGR
ncbi:acetyl-CoA carboxyl transferase [Cryobacterium roopkundense]|uniref:Acetyl-coenzyme A carboxylase carboxyl transferase subunits beta/alpha n=1 Tax=Cryobacterium roopkundense TaxID=1001240 RepID=A0A099J553_9MICO|nr:carboxyl transferase domain-containing protein [Cryobacterium roopkundense]KGJ72602.1 acetyl-CoA carboxyl transferase [Cryobacterium roopkundense]MBB5642907.1 acetyl-CoA carboxylase carboxyl transferase subunit beta [Cryobacterium roopkundense]